MRVDPRLSTRHPNRRPSDHRPGRRRSTTLVATLLALALGPGLAAAHVGPHGHVSWVPAAVFVVGVAAIAGSVAAEALGVIDRRVANIGVGTGAVGFVASIVLAVLGV